MGKTTFEQKVQEYVGTHFCKILSTVDFIKRIAFECGWDGVKTPNNRKFLADLKDLLIKWDDIPFKKTCDSVREIQREWKEYGLNLDKTVIFIDCREPEEIKKLCDELGAKSLLIKRENSENEVILNSADSRVLQYNYDIIIDTSKNVDSNDASAAIKFVNSYVFKK